MVSLHLLVPQHHCRSSSQACALGCLKTGTIPGQRAQHRPVWRMTRRQRSRKGRSPARWKRSECWEVSSGRGASRQMCRSLEQHSPLAVKITIMVNHGHKSFFTKQQKKKNQNCFGLITDIFAICPEYIFNQLNVASLMQTIREHHVGLFKKKNQSYKTLLASTESIYIFGAALETISSEV